MFSSPGSLATSPSKLRIAGAAPVAVTPFQAPHGPWNCPPPTAYIGDEYSQCDPEINPDPDDLDAYRGMMQIVDEQLDLLLDNTAVDLTPMTGDTYVFFLSDNGSPGDADLALPPFENETRVKGTVFEGGVRVPFFAAGPDVVDGGSSVALFKLTEDFAEDTNLCNPNCDATEEDIIDELLECGDQFRDTSCQDAILGASCGPSDPCCPGLFCGSVTQTCVDPI